VDIREQGELTMGLQEWAINLAILSIVINAALFVVFPAAASSDAFGCLVVLNGGLSDYAPSDKPLSGSCIISSIDPPDITSVTDVSENPLDQAAAAINAAVGSVVFVVEMLIIVVEIIFTFFFLGWASIFDVLFLNYPDVQQVMFPIAITISSIQVVGLLFVLTDIVQRLRRVI